MHWVYVTSYVQIKENYEQNYVTDFKYLIKFYLISAFGIFQTVNRI